MTNRSLDHAIAALAGRQHGSFQRSQVMGLGGTDDQISSRLAAGAWDRAGEGVYRLCGEPRSWHNALAVAWLAADRLAVASHEAAAALHHLPSFPPGRVVVTVPHGAARLHHLATVHQSRNLPTDHLTVIDGLPVTSMSRTMVDLAAVCRRPRLEMALDDALARRDVSVEEVWACFEQIAGRGRPGSRLLRSVLLDRHPGEVPPDSRLERLLLRVLRRGGLPRPELQYPFPGRWPGEGRVDAAYPAVRLVIEADSRRWHTRKQDFAVDRARDNQTVLAGWRVLRFTWEDLTVRPDEVIAMVRVALAMAA